MRKLLIFLLALALVAGMAVALPRWGPPNGFYNKVIQVNDLMADNDVTVGGNLGVNGTIVDDGAIDQYISTVGISNTGVIANSGSLKNGGTALLNVVQDNGTIRVGGNAAFMGTSKTTGASTLDSLSLNKTLAVTGYSATTGLSNTGNLNNVGNFKNSGTAAFGGDVTLNSSVALALTTVDKLTENGVIIPQFITKETEFGANSSDKEFYAPPQNCKIDSITESHATAGDGGTVTAVVKKCTAGQSIGSCQAVMDGTFSLANSSVNTRYPASLYYRGGNFLLLNSTDILAVDFTGSLHASTGGLIEVKLERQL